MGIGEEAYDRADGVFVKRVPSNRHDHRVYIPRFGGRRDGIVVVLILVLDLGFALAFYAFYIVATAQKYVRARFGKGLLLILSFSCRGCVPIPILIPISLNPPPRVINIHPCEPEIYPALYILMPTNTKARDGDIGCRNTELAQGGVRLDKPEKFSSHSVFTLVKKMKRRKAN